MKKMMLAMIMSVVVVFTAAVGLCIQVLGSAQVVSDFLDAGMRIVLDAGHGGIDGGVVGRTSGVKESDINLAVTYQTKAALEELGFDVVLTRKTEAGLYGTSAKGFKRRDMEKRKELIQDAAPNLLLSIHQNYYPSKTTRGGQVFYKKSDERGKKFADGLQEKLNALYQKEKAKPRISATGDYYLLNCFVLVDLKVGRITHQDVGQMDMYVRMFDELKRGEGHNPTIGIVLCSETSKDIARYSILKGNEQLFATKYKLLLPTPEELQAEIENQKEIFLLQNR